VGRTPRSAAGLQTGTTETGEFDKTIDSQLPLLSWIIIVNIMKPYKTASALTGAAALGVATVGFAIGAFAIGALAIGALGVGRLAVKRGRIDRLSIGELTVDRLIIRDDSPPNRP
jgi:hypothetical protein